MPLLLIIPSKLEEIIHLAFLPPKKPGDLQEDPKGDLKVPQGEEVLSGRSTKVRRTLLWRFFETRKKNDLILGYP